MSLSESLGTHLPYLRRFARALTGSQDCGDRYVVATLESVIAEPGSITAENARVLLYQRFLQVWNTVPLNRIGTPPARDGAATLSLASITPLPRQAFLLTSVEGFSTEEAAHILSRPPDAVMALLQQAGREMAQQVATDVLIIEDEPLIALELETIVKGLGHSVTGIARTHREALASAERRDPGIILADVQLADGSSGLDAVKDILQNVATPVIFITAFPERLLTGTRPEPTFLITKPFDTNTVRAVISQALFFGLSAHPVTAQ